MVRTWVTSSIGAFRGKLLASLGDSVEFLDFLASKREAKSREGLLQIYKNWLEEEYDDVPAESGIEDKLTVANRLLNEFLPNNLIGITSTGEIVVPSSKEVKELASGLRTIMYSTPRLVRVCAYYLVSTEGDFSTEVLLELVSSKEEFVRAIRQLRFVMENSTPFEFDPEYDEGPAHRLFLKTGNALRVNQKFKSHESSLSFSRPTSDKLFYAAVKLRSQKMITQTDIISVIRQAEGAAIEKYLSQFLTRKGSMWTFTGKLESLIEDIEEPMRRPKGEIDDQILDLIDEGGFSNDQLSRLLEADPSTISRSIKRLKRDRLVITTGGFGEYKRIYWMTNCDNCPWGLKSEDCRSDSIKRIRSLISDWRATEIPNFTGYRNQTLLSMANVLTTSKEQMEREDYRPDLKEFKDLANAIFRPIAKVIGKNGFFDSRRRIFQIGGKEIPLPIQYLMGLSHGLEGGADKPR